MTEEEKIKVTITQNQLLLAMANVLAGMALNSQHLSGHIENMFEACKNVSIINKNLMAEVPE